MTTVVAGWGLVLLARTRLPRWIGSTLRIVAVITVLMVLLSRVYLGVHYPSDVVAGVSLGVGWGLFWEGRFSRSTAVASSAPATR